MEHRMTDEESESSAQSYQYEIFQKTVELEDVDLVPGSTSQTLAGEVWTSETSSHKHKAAKMRTSTPKTHERKSSKKDKLVNMNDQSKCKDVTTVYPAKSDDKKDETDITLNAVFSRLVDSLDRNTEVMNCVLYTMEALSRAGRASLPEDADIIMPDARLDKVTVELKCTFLRISDIDTLNQQFEAELFVQAKWEEPLLSHTLLTTDKDKLKEGLDKLIPWDPKLIVMNIDGAFVLNRKTFDIRFEEPGYRSPVVVQLWRFKGFFKENLELEHFPVDVQELTVSLSTERSDEEVELIEDQNALSSVNTKAFLDQEWNLYNHVETARDMTTVEYCSAVVHPILHCQCRVARKMGYFVWNIVFVMMLINSLTFAAFTIDYNIPDRLNVTITLFLTAVAFKLVVSQSLPDISYLTYMDVYVIAALIFLGLQAAQNATMNGLGNFLERELVEYYDKWSMLFMATILIVFHIVYAIYIYSTASKRRRIMKEKDKLYAAKREFLEKYGSLPPRYENPVDLSFDYDSIIPGRKLKSAQIFSD